MTEMHKEVFPLDLVGVQEYVRTLIRSSPDRAQLALDARVKYNALCYFVQNPGSNLRIADLQKMAKHFGVYIAAVVAQPSVAA